MTVSPAHTLPSGCSWPDPDNPGHWEHSPECLAGINRCPNEQAAHDDGDLDARIRLSLDDWTQGFMVPERRGGRQVWMKTDGPCDGCGEPIEDGAMCYLRYVRHGGVVRRTRYHAGCEVGLEPGFGEVEP